MKKAAIISDVICLLAVVVVFIFKIEDSEIWFKAIMSIIILGSFTKLIYDIKKNKHNKF